METLHVLSNSYLDFLWDAFYFFVWFWLFAGVCNKLIALFEIYSQNVLINVNSLSVLEDSYIKQVVVDGSICILVSNLFPDAMAYWKEWKANYLSNQQYALKVCVLNILYQGSCQFWKDIYFIMEKILMLYLGYILSKFYPPPPPPPKKFFSVPGSMFLPSANKCYRLCIA